MSDHLGIAAAPLRRRLTLLFTDLSASSGLARALEAEHYRALLQALRALWHGVAAQFQGQVVLAQGDGALMAFGVDGDGEAAGLQAARAALALHAAVKALVVEGLPPRLHPLQCHSGIHAGMVLVEAGGIELGRLDLSGDVANTAARLSDFAAPDQVLASQAALGRHLHRLRTAPFAPPLASDLPAMALHRLLGLTAGPAPVHGEPDQAELAWPFVGRASELQTLRQHLLQPEPGALRCHLVLGEPGQGKSRLLRRLATDLLDAGCTVWSGQCDNAAGSGVLQPFRQILSQAGVADAYVAAQDPDGVAALLQQQCSGTNALVLVLDDWQWADDATRHLMERLGALPQGPRIVLAARPRDDGEPWVMGCPAVALPALSGGEAADLVRHHLPNADPLLVGRILHDAGGNPLCIEELCHAAAAGARLRQQPGSGPSARHGWLAAMLMARQDRLDADTRELLQAAAVVGVQTDSDQLAAAWGHRPDAELVNRLLQADFLRREGGPARLAFKHVIAHEAVYDSIGLQRRRALHRRLYDHLRRQTPAEPTTDELSSLAHHAAGCGAWADAATWGDRAGDRAMTWHAMDRARTLYLAAVQALEQLPAATTEQAALSCTLVHKIGLTAVFDPLALNDDLSLFDRALAQARANGNASLERRSLYWQGYVLYAFGRFRRAEPPLRQALAQAEQHQDERLAAQVRAALGQVLSAVGDYNQAQPLMASALSDKRKLARPGSGVAIGSAYTLACLASTQADQGRFAEAESLFQQALLLLGDTTHPVAMSVRNWYAVALCWQGRWREAGLQLVDSTQRAVNTGVLLTLVVCRVSIGYARAHEQNRDPDSGRHLLEQAVAWMQSHSGRFYSSVHWSWLAELQARAGESRLARRSALHALARCRDGEALGEAAAARVLAALAWQRQRTALCERWLRRADRAARRRGSARELLLNRWQRALCQANLLANADTAPGLALPDALDRPALAQAFHAAGMAWHAAQVMA